MEVSKNVTPRSDAVADKTQFSEFYHGAEQGRGSVVNPLPIRLVVWYPLPPTPHPLKDLEVHIKGGGR